MQQNILSVTDLRTIYISRNSIVPAVDGVSFDLGKKEAIGIVGESGCGKSTVARSIVGLLDKSYARITSGEIVFDGRNLVGASADQLRRIRGNEIAMIFQDPFVSLNPVFTVEAQIREILATKLNMSRRQARERIKELLHLVGIPAPEMRMKSYPYQLSGGMQQRVMIAIALACNPKILIADEPTTALDVTVQAQILDLIGEIKDKFDMSLILISHNLGIVAEMCDRIVVMYGGVVVEHGNVDDIFANPRHPYTQGLLASIPRIHDDLEELHSIGGTVPTFTLPVQQCRFADRCPRAFDACSAAEPPLFTLNDGGAAQEARCWLYTAEIKAKR